MAAAEGEILALLRERFSSLDKRLDRQDQALEDIHREAKRTNGRIGKLEQWRGEQEAVSEKVEELTRQRDDEAAEAEEERRTRRTKAIEIAIGSATILLAAILPLILTGAL
ncbi:MAG TPA: hypothetical protein VGF95_14445 [Solirubrobacteraceae bacterium]|jgi:hypothetical protein